MGFSVYQARKSDDPQLPKDVQPEKYLYGGAETLDAAKVLAEEAFLKKEYGPETIAFVVEDVIHAGRVYTNIGAKLHTAAGTDPATETAKLNLQNEKTHKQTVADAWATLREALAQVQAK